MGSPLSPSIAIIFYALVADFGAAFRVSSLALSANWLKFLLNALASSLPFLSYASLFFQLFLGIKILSVTCYSGYH